MQKKSFIQGDKKTIMRKILYLIWNFLVWIVVLSSIVASLIVVLIFILWDTSPIWRFQVVLSMVFRAIVLMSLLLTLYGSWWYEFTK